MLVIGGWGVQDEEDFETGVNSWKGEVTPGLSPEFSALVRGGTNSNICGALQHE